MKHVKKNAFMPVFWIEIQEELSQNHKDLFEELDFAMKVLFYITIVGFIVSPIAFVVACTSSHVHHRRRQRIELKKRRSLLFDALLLESGDNADYYHRKYVTREDVFRHPALIMRMVTCFFVTAGLSAALIWVIQYLDLIHWETHDDLYIALEVVAATFVAGVITAFFTIQIALQRIQLGAYPTVFWPELVYIETKGELGRQSETCCSDPLVYIIRPIARIENSMVISFVMGAFSCVLFSCPFLILIFTTPYGDSSEYIVLGLIVVYVAFQSTFVFTLVWLKVASGPFAPVYDQLYMVDSD